ncbi:MAG: hypothetical protein LBM77_10335 [Spirochaetaceae bacterium]|nr:hypothetical protein [Spirochaetaceae bacterium]
MEYSKISNKEYKRLEDVISGLCNGICGHCEYDVPNGKENSTCLVLWIKAILMEHISS